ncbi:MAG: ABC transporter permease [Acidobacteria bacterium]|nr:ABC transporter permease [Acidobacteriota bacterium]
MAVYQHTYQQYSGPSTPLWSRFLIIPRYAYKSVFQSKLFTGLFAVCFAPLLLMTILIYLKHNISVLEAFNARVSDIGFDVNGFFFRIFTSLQTSLGFLLTVIIGPTLISRDLSNNALPLYLCRPLSRADYVIGKMSVIMILLSLITWVPLLILFVFQAYLEGGSWLWDNLYVARAVFVISWTWIIILALLATALSGWLKWRIAASGALFAVFVVPTPITIIINEMFRSNVGTLLHPGFLMNMLMDKLFRMENTFTPDWMVPPTWSMWASLATLALICVGLLSLKVRAYEVVK